MEMPDNFEKRSYLIEGAESRAGEQDMIVEGYAAVFNSWSNDLGGFVERIDPSAFDGVLGKRDVRALVDHDWSKLLGRESAGTLELSVDERGLKYKITLPETSLGKDINTLVKRGDLKENSFAFTVRKDDWKENKETGTYERTITEINDLFEVSIVSLPAYNDATIAQRSLDQIKADKAAELEAAQKEIEDRNAMLENYTQFINSLKES